MASAPWSSRHPEGRGTTTEVDCRECLADCCDRLGQRAGRQHETPKLAGSPRTVTGAPARIERGECRIFPAKIRLEACRLATGPGGAGAMHRGRYVSGIDKWLPHRRGTTAVGRRRIAAARAATACCNTHERSERNHATRGQRSGWAHGASGHGHGHGRSSACTSRTRRRGGDRLGAPAALAATDHAHVVSQRRRLGRGVAGSRGPGLAGIEGGRRSAAWRACS